MQAVSDEQILFPDAEVEGYTVRPWCLAQLVEVSEPLAAVVEIAKQEGAADALLSLVGMAEPRKGKASGGKTVPIDFLALLPGLILKSVRHIPRILSVTLRVSEEEVGKLDLGKTTAILMAIFSQNYEYLKNYFGPDTRKLKIAG